MTTAHGADQSSQVRCEPTPFSYELEASYTRQFLLNAVVVVVLAAITATLALSLATASA
jgi:hypothetical protein